MLITQELVNIFILFAYDVLSENTTSTLKGGKRLEKRVSLKKSVVAGGNGDDFKKKRGYLEDPLEYLLSRISEFPVLPNDEQARLALLAQQGDQDARVKLGLSNLKFVIKIAKRFHRRNLEIELLDLVNEGFKGLFDEAIDKYDPNENASFCTYAHWWIEQKIRLYIKNNSRVIRISIPALNKINKIRIASSILFTLLGKENPDPAEIASFINREEGGEEITSREVEYLIQLDRATLHLDGFTNREDGNRVVDTDNLPFLKDNNRFDPEQQLIIKEELESCRKDLNRLIEKLKRLSPKKRCAFIMFYGLDGSLSRKTFQSVADLLKITRQAVQLRVQNVWQKLSLSDNRLCDSWVSDTLEKAKRLGEILHLDYEELARYLFPQDDECSDQI